MERWLHRFPCPKHPFGSGEPPATPTADGAGVWGSRPGDAEPTHSTRVQRLGWEIIVLFVQNMEVISEGWQARCFPTPDGRRPTPPRFPYGRPCFPNARLASRLARAGFGRRLGSGAVPSWRQRRGGCHRSWPWSQAAVRPPSPLGSGRAGVPFRGVHRQTWASAKYAAHALDGLQAEPGPWLQVPSAPYTARTFAGGTSGWKRCAGLRM